MRVLISLVGVMFASVLVVFLMVFRTFLDLLIRLLCIKHLWIARGDLVVCTKCGRIGHLNGGHKIKKASIFKGLF